MIQANYIWKLAVAEPPADFLKLTKKKHCDALTSQILWSRGLHDEASLSDFLKPTLEMLHDPFLLHDMEKAVARILAAIEKGEKILIYGDYDADGMTSSSVMKSALDELGAECQVYLPNRFTDGYGPNLDVYKYFVENEHIDLIITVDNGVAGNEAIAWAQEHGTDVVVTDHHSLPDVLPEAYAIVHPLHPDSHYPFKELAGVGVAFKVACALLEYIPTEMLDLVAIGTVADMMALTDENRVLVTFGLKALAQTERVGLLELMKLAGSDLDNLSAETISFQLAPRLNALGRLDDPNPAVELLTGWDEEEAVRIAKLIDDKNTERKAIADQIYDEALKMLDDAPVQVLYKSGWHKGVLGIVAGRILEQIHKPVLMLSEEEGLLRGSARSTENYNIFDALNSHRDLLVAFGGHAQAAGMTIKLEQIESVKQVLVDFVTDNNLEIPVKSELELDASVKFDEITLETIENLAKLEPYGIGNPKPRFLLEDFKVSQARSMGQNNQHLKLRLEQNGKQLDAIYFGHGAQSLEFEQVPLALEGTLSSNTWNGVTTVQFMIDDAAATDIELLDLRSQQINLPTDTLVFEKNSVKNGIIDDVLVVKDAPDSQAALSNLTEILRQPQLKVIYFKNNIDKRYYLTGAGTREQFAKLYKAIYQYPEFDVRYKLKNLAQYLKIPELLLVKMIQIFAELDFVKIDNGVMTVNKTAAHREISDSSIYQELQELVKLQQLFALASVREIYEKLTKEE